MSESTRVCPICTAGLLPHIHEGVELDICPTGHGTWLDKGELSAVVASEEVDQSVADEQAARALASQDAGHAVVAESTREQHGCPVCNAAMRVREYPGSGVAIDECAEHGVWLDAGELERIEAYGEAMRREVTDGVAGAAPGTSVRGLPIPAHILAALSSSSRP